MSILTKDRALITGASSGIGKAMAHSLASKGCDLFLLARRAEKLFEVKKEISLIHPSVNIHLISADVNDPGVIDQISAATEQKLDIFINNAGLALGREKVQDSSFTDWEVMINTNITSSFRLVHAIVPWMLNQGKGDIINLCSVAGHYTYSGGAAYCATKHALLALTRSLREETCGRNLRVMQISPGMVETEFSQVRFRGDKDQADQVYKNMIPLKPEDIARMMIFMLEQPRHVVIDEIITMPTDQGSPVTVSRRNS
jgi:3-hydroxy acid dehydrogenase/malonic semialdehyde reductase